jgi:hypothetical protein
VAVLAVVAVVSEEKVRAGGDTLWWVAILRLVLNIGFRQPAIVDIDVPMLYTYLFAGESNDALDQEGWPSPWNWWRDDDDISTLRGFAAV